MPSLSNDEQVSIAIGKYTNELVATAKRHADRAFWLGTLVGALMTIIFVVAVGVFFEAAS